MPPAKPSHLQALWKAMRIAIGALLLVACNAGDTGEDTGAYQCIPCDNPRMVDGDLDVSPETPVQTLHCLEEVSGTLRLSGFESSFPEELHSLRNVGRLSISENGVSSLRDFGCLERVENLDLRNNATLRDVSALADVAIGSELTLAQNPDLVDASPIRVGSKDVALYMRIEFNDALVFLPTPVAGATVSKLTIASNPSLRALDGLASLRFVSDGDLWIASNKNLRSLAGIKDIFAGLSEPSESLDGVIIESLTNLESLAGMEKLHRSSYLYVGDLPLVTELSGLAGLSKVETLVLSRLPKVDDFDSLGKNLEVEVLSIGSCYSGMGNLTGMASANGIASVGTLQILNNPYFTSFEDFSPAGPLAITAIRNPNLQAATVAAFAEKQGTEETCVYPPNQMCTCLE